jgi:hypothetical protein
MSANRSAIRLRTTAPSRRHHSLLEAMREGGVDLLVFSSTCATYGPAAAQRRSHEDHPQQPVNPYGATKLMVEGMLRDYGKAYGLRWAALRYFNAAGADPDGEIGEMHEPETHAIPLRNICRARPHTVISALWLGLSDPGWQRHPRLCPCRRSCRRRMSRPSTTSRAGVHRWRSISEPEPAPPSCRSSAPSRPVTGQRVPTTPCDRRPGDPSALVADGRRGPTRSWDGPRASHTMESIVTSAWRWPRIGPAAGVIRNSELYVGLVGERFATGADADDEWQRKRAAVLCWACTGQAPLR